MLLDYAPLVVVLHCGIYVEAYCYYGDEIVHAGRYQTCVSLHSSPDKYIISGLTIYWLARSFVFALIGFRQCVRSGVSKEVLACNVSVSVYEAEEEANQSGSAEVTGFSSKGTTSQRPHVGCQLLGKYSLSSLLDLFFYASDEVRGESGDRV